MNIWLRSCVVGALLTCGTCALLWAADRRTPAPVAGERGDVDRSPVDLVLTADERWLVTVNQTAGTVSLVDVAAAQVVAELPCGQRPTAVALAADGRRVLVTAKDSGELFLFDLAGDTLIPAGSVRVGYRPHGVVVSGDGRTAYVAQEAAARVAVIDLAGREVVEYVAVDRWPRFLALSPDGSRLAVGTSGDVSVSVVDTVARKMLYSESVEGINLGQMQCSDDGRYVYVAYMVYRQNPITAANIRRGWVLGTRIGRIRLDGSARREAITLDPQGLAVSDPHGLALTSDARWIVATGSGTHELLAYHVADLKFQDFGGPGDHIDPGLLHRPDRFYRLELGGRPLAVRLSGDNRRAYVANYLANAVQVVDLDARRIAATIALGGPAEPSLVRRGEAIFYDGRRSLDQWYSCHSCHYEGGTNAVAMDTHNDRTDKTFKTVIPLNNVSQTAPWTWHGWQTSLDDAMRTSLTETMLGPQPSDDDVRALKAYLSAMPVGPNPFRGPGGELSAAAEQGRAVFNSARAGCATCHNGPYFTDGQTHDVGLGSPKDAFAGYNTPSLVGLYARVRFLHDGRAKSLESVLGGAHNPARVAGQGELTDAERAVLIEYLKSL